MPPHRIIRLLEKSALLWIAYLTIGWCGGGTYPTTASKRFADPASVHSTWNKGRSSGLSYAACRSPAKSVPYDTLSYIWAADPDGRFDESSEILFDGQILIIGETIRDALQMIRHADEPRMLWVDAICIDRGNDREGGPQVGLTRMIYKTARQVVICVGKGFF
ncbi:hypothetical protein K432DRAFT_442942 [Lepidopterella palustris CBS 459.81]|uniref:Heterokaryon incompatibility domain-containing protein n=1 Tax=Lepidopterella palustris CBS 459.81 TaxID=1314670 RepID=A0A8E2JFR1_9PEZI|nr:hypothetical protein K432DRAFT_442942 [Lepidopterella palustris CBS 459.81]